MLTKLMTNDTPRVLFVGRLTTDVCNLGDDAQFKAIYDDLGSRVDGLRVSALSDNRAGTTLHSRLDLKVTWLANLHHLSRSASENKFFLGFNRDDDGENLQQIISAMSACDCVVLSGGPMFNPMSRGLLRGLPFEALIYAILARALGKPLATVAVEISRGLYGEDRDFAKAVLEMSDVVTARDSESLAAIESLQIQPRKLLGAPDPAFALLHWVRRIIQDSKPAENTIGVVLRDFPNRGEGATWIDANQEIVEDLLQRFENIVLIPQDLCNDPTAGDNDNVAAHELLQGLSKFGGRVVVREVANLEDFVLACANVELLVSNRRHAVAIAAMVGTPCVGIGTFAHIGSMMGELGLQEFFVEPNREIAVVVGKKTEACMRGRDVYREALKVRVDKLCEQAQGHGAAIAELLQG